MDTFRVTIFVLQLLIKLAFIPSAAAGVVYYVKPTEPCAHNSSSCPSNETCHTMDHYASNSSHYFSPDLINVTLYFMCGVHNFIQQMNISDLYSFAMIGTAERQHITLISTPLPTNTIRYSCSYRFSNVTRVRIENSTVYFISLSFEGNTCLFMADHVSFHGYVRSTSSMVSILNITNSEVMLKECTFQHNYFVRIQSHAILNINNCNFNSYNHVLHSAIEIDSSTIRLSGDVHFINNTIGSDILLCGGAIASRVISPCDTENTNFLLISTGANVSFINNTSTLCGGAISLRCTVINITTNATLLLSGNSVTHPNSEGGALYIVSTNLVISDATLHARNNRANHGGAIIQRYGVIRISNSALVLCVNNKATFAGGAIFSNTHISVDGNSSLVFHNNSAYQGGALYLQHASGTTHMSIINTSLVHFNHNSAEQYGGAVYVDNQECLFYFHAYSSKVIFEGNIAKEGIGMHVYGASIKDCMQAFCSHDIVSYIPNVTSSLYSPVSSDPKRVCLCDGNGKPQCTNISSIFVNGHKVYRGESVNVSLVVVGYDFGVTTGEVSAGFIPSPEQSTLSLRHNQYHQWTGPNLQCSNVTYNLYSKFNVSKSSDSEILCLHTSEAVYYHSQHYLQHLIEEYIYSNHRCGSLDLFKTPVFINFSILNGCPPGFILTLQGDVYGCDCYSILQRNHFDCYITNNTGYLKWNSTMWVNATFNKNESDGVLVGHHCPLNYCKSGHRIVNLNAYNNRDQCDNNHAGTLCGGCEKGYSLAIGTSHCIKCSNDSHLLIMAFFFIIGVILVSFIFFLNLTVTQGLINGLVLYANLLWTYKYVLFTPELQQQSKFNSMLQIFIAWLNLDFGIEMCLVNGLTAFWKTWLQFLFPLYIWLIAGVIIIACRYSSRLTNLIGDRAVPLLATLFLLSYTKLLRTVTTILEFGVLVHYPYDSKIIVWFMDGSLHYCHHPHIYLFIVAIITLFFCLSYTLFLLPIQCWRRLSHLRLLRWINKFTPFYDAYFAPLKDKHHYCFGSTLLVRGALLVAFTATSTTIPLVSLLILAISLATLLFYVSIWSIYRSKIVRILESLSILNLFVLVIYTLYTMAVDGSSLSTALQLSIGLAFIQFLAIVIISIVNICYHNKSNKLNCIWKFGYRLISQDSLPIDDILHEKLNDSDIKVDTTQRETDSIDTY